MDGLSGRARQYWYDQRRSLKIYDPRGVHVTTGTSHTWCINTGADMELLSTFLLTTCRYRLRHKQFYNSRIMPAKISLKL